jgi:hypothetical protein
LLPSTPLHGVRYSQKYERPQESYEKAFREKAKHRVPGNQVGREAACKSANYTDHDIYQISEQIIATGHGARRCPPDYAGENPT